MKLFRNVIKVYCYLNNVSADLFFEILYVQTYWINGNLGTFVDHISRNLIINPPTFCSIIVQCSTILRIFIEEQQHTVNKTKDLPHFYSDEKKCFLLICLKCESLFLFLSVSWVRVERWWWLVQTCHR